jgi:hypothetical protein
MVSDSVSHKKISRSEVECKWDNSYFFCNLSMTTFLGARQPAMNYCRKLVQANARVGMYQKKSQMLQTAPARMPTSPLHCIQPSLFHHHLHHVLTLASIHQSHHCSCCLEAPPAFKTPPSLCPLAPIPLLPLICRLVVATPLIAPPLPLVLLMLRCTLSADISPPVCHLFASGLLCCSCCCADASFRSLDMPPPLCDAPPPLVLFSSRLPLLCWLVVMSHLIALPPPCINFC